MRDSQSPVHDYDHDIDHLSYQYYRQESLMLHIVIGVFQLHGLQVCSQAY